jgi:hypothetical protein
VPTIEYWNEAQLAELISAHTYKYPAIKLRTVAGILLHKNSQILDRFSLKEKVVIIGYIMGKSKTFLGDIYPDLDIQNCIDRLRNSIITR